jgi:hypothetical protein
VAGEPLETVSSVENIFVFNALLSLDRGKTAAETLARLTLNDYLSNEEYVPRPKPSDDEEQVTATALVIDQFEEIFTTNVSHWEKREDFFRQLKQAMKADPLLWVVLAMREEHVGALAPFVHLLPGGLRARFYMQRMGADAALKAVEGPAQLHGVPFEEATRDDEPGAAERLVRNLRQIRLTGSPHTTTGQFVEPVHIQVVCYQLWENLMKRDPIPDTITRQHVEKLGDVDTVLADFYTAAVSKVAKESGRFESDIHEWFRDNLITETRTRGMVDRGKEMTRGMDNKLVVEPLERERILRSVWRAAATWYELSHDRLVDPILQAIEKWWSKQGPLLRTAREWDTSGDDSYLYFGKRLSEEENNLAEQENVDPLVIRFIKASREAEETRKKTILRQTRLIVILSVAVVGLIILPIVVIFQNEGEKRDPLLLAFGGLLVLYGVVAVFVDFVVKRVLKRRAQGNSED